MIITKQVLQQLIDEEFSRAIKKRQKKLTEGFHGGGSGDMYEMDSTELIEFAKAYASLGDAVASQLDTILDGNERDFPSQTNSNAIKIIEDELGGVNEEIDTAIKAYNDWWESKGKDYDESEEDDGTYAAAARANDMTWRR